MSSSRELVWVAGVAVTLGAVVAVAAASSGRRRPKQTPKAVMVIGDSMAQGLHAPLRVLAAKDGAALRTAARVGSRFDQWTTDPELVSAVQQAKGADLAIVVLGTNDEYMEGDPAARQRSDVAALVNELEGTRSLWVTPPTLPKGDSMARLLMELAPNALDSRRFELERQPDQIHPTSRGFADWSSRIWRAVKA